jgi:hypothetical protein
VHGVGHIGGGGVDEEEGELDDYAAEVFHVDLLFIRLSKSEYKAYFDKEKINHKVINNC